MCGKCRRFEVFVSVLPRVEELRDLEEGFASACSIERNGQRRSSNRNSVVSIQSCGYCYASMGEDLSDSGNEQNINARHAPLEKEEVGAS